MRILVDITHPAEVHFFRPLIRALEARGDSVLVTALYKPGVAELLKAFEIRHRRIARPWPTPVGVALSVAVRSLRITRIAAAFRPHVMVARVGAPIGAAGRLLGIPSISYDENEYATAQLFVTRKLATVLCTGMGYEKDLGRKQVRFNAPPQLVYTHPCRYTPDAEGLRTRGIDPAAPYVVLRLSSWQALHDFGHGRRSEHDVLRLAEALSAHARVIVSAEGEMPASLARYANTLHVSKGLDLLALASLYVGEGGSMAAEAACLGVPSIFVSPLRCGYLNALRLRYGLVAQPADWGDAARLALDALTDPARRARAQQSRRQLLKDAGDPLDFMIKVVDEYARRD